MCVIFFFLEILSFILSRLVVLIQVVRPAQYACKHILFSLFPSQSVCFSFSLSLSLSHSLSVIRFALTLNEISKVYVFLYVVFCYPVDHDNAIK